MGVDQLFDAVSRRTMALSRVRKRRRKSLPSILPNFFISVRALGQAGFLSTVTDAD
jgi:hypothetical protein